jgi:hypothetical protein
MFLKKDQRGSFMIEAVLSFLLLLIILVGINEVLSLVESKLYVEKISRAVCYEAAITSVEEANQIRDMFILQYFNDEEERQYVHIQDLTQGSTDEYIYCYVSYYHPPFKYIFPEKDKGRSIPVMLKKGL